MKVGIINLKEIENSMEIVKYQRELQVLLHSLHDMKKRELELLKRCKTCASQVARLKPLVNKELVLLNEEEKKEVNKMLKELHLKI